MTRPIILWQSAQPPLEAAVHILVAAGYEHVPVVRSIDVLDKQRVVGIVAGHEERWTADTVRHFPALRVLQRLGVGMDNVDIAELEASGIRVGSVPDYGTTDVADHTLAMLLDLSRHLTVRSERLRHTGAGGWQVDLQNGFRLRGRRMAILGLGRIGLSVARRAAAFGLDVLFYDPFLPEGIEKALGWTRADSLRDVAAADICSLHCPATPANRNLIERAYWDDVAKVGPACGQVLINTARGSLLDWDAFTTAFARGTVRAAAFDVLPTEPFDDDDPLIKRWQAGDAEVHGRLLVTPHAAFACPEATSDLHGGAATRIVAALTAGNDRRPLESVV